MWVYENANVIMVGCVLIIIFDSLAVTSLGHWGTIISFFVVLLVKNPILMAQLLLLLCHFFHNDAIGKNFFTKMKRIMLY